MRAMRPTNRRRGLPEAIQQGSLHSVFNTPAETCNHRCRSSCAVQSIAEACSWAGLTNVSHRKGTVFISRFPTSGNIPCTWQPARTKSILRGVRRKEDQSNSQVLFSLRTPFQLSNTSGSVRTARSTIIVAERKRRILRLFCV